MKGELRYDILNFLYENKSKGYNNLTPFIHENHKGENQKFVCDILLELNHDAIDIRNDTNAALNSTIVNILAIGQDRGNFDAFDLPVNAMIKTNGIKELNEISFADSVKRVNDSVEKVNKRFWIPIIIAIAAVVISAFGVIVELIKESRPMQLKLPPTINMRIKSHQDSASKTNHVMVDSLNTK